MSETTPITGNQSAQLLKFHFVKSNYFRVVHCDGVFGGITPSGKIQMTIFSQRHPLPQYIVHEISPTGNVGPERRDLRVGKEGVVREMEVDVVMDLPMAISIRKWLDEKIETLASSDRNEKES